MLLFRQEQLSAVTVANRCCQAIFAADAVLQCHLLPNSALNAEIRDNSKTISQ